MSSSLHTRVPQNPHMATTWTQNLYMKTKMGHSSLRNDNTNPEPLFTTTTMHAQGHHSTMTTIGPPRNDHRNQNPCTTTTTRTPIWGHCNSTKSIHVFYFKFMLNSHYSTTWSQCPHTTTTTQPQGHCAMTTTRAQSPCATTTTMQEPRNIPLSSSLTH